MKRPIFTLAPMAGVTDFVFRELISKYGKPDVMWTEFVSADGLISLGKKRLLVDLKYSDKQRPIVAQLFSSRPEAMKKAARIVAELGFDGLDINMGCPDRSVEKHGGGAALMKDQNLAISLIRAAREGVSDGTSEHGIIPVSVKTRIGYNKIDLDWLRSLLKQDLPALTIHLRTRKEMSKVPAHWELMPDIMKLRDEISPGTLIIGNGDVVSAKDGANKCKKYGCDGVMIGRGIFGNPWLFENIGVIRRRRVLSKSLGKVRSAKERLVAMVGHTKLFEKTFKGIKSFDLMKKHFKAYVSGWDGAKELRVKLMATKKYREVKEVVRDIV